MKIWRELLRTKAEDWLFYALEPNQTPNGYDKVVAPPEQYYLNLFLKSYRIVDVRKGLNKFYGTVHSFISVPHRGGNLAEFNVVTTSGNLEELDAANIDKVINIDKRLLGPIPYRGGDVKVDIGLFSIKSADLIKPFISLLEELSSLAGVSFISSALPYAAPISKGINLLVSDQGDSVLEIGISQSLQEIKTGCYIVMRAPKGSINPEKMSLGTDYKLMDENGNPLEKYPYLVYEISISSKRPDYFNIPEISKSYKLLQEDVRNGKFTEAEDSLKIFKRAVLTCDDLLFKDAQEIVKQVESEIKSILDTTTVSKSRTFFLRDLNTFNIY